MTDLHQTQLKPNADAVMSRFKVFARGKVNAATTLPYLEPIFLDNTLVLNAHTYLNGGTARSIERTDAFKSSKALKASLGLPLAQDLVQMSAGSESAQMIAIRQAREVAIGGLHMQVINEFAARGLLQDVCSPDDLGPTSANGYWKVHARLKPVEIVSAINVLRFVAPLLKQIATELPSLANVISSFGKLETLRSGAMSMPATQSHRVGFSDLFSQSVDMSDFLDKLAARLERDFDESNQLIMMMVTPDVQERIIGTTALDLTDYKANQLQSRLSYSDVYVVGKVTRRLSEGTRVPILAGTALTQSLELLKKLVDGVASAGTDLGSKEREQLTNLIPLLAQLFPFYLTGPAVSLRAMSICI